MADLEVSYEDGIATLTMNRPKASFPESILRRNLTMCLAVDNGERSEEELFIKKVRTRLHLPHCLGK